MQIANLSKTKIFGKILSYAQLNLAHLVAQLTYSLKNKKEGGEEIHQNFYDFFFLNNCDLIFGLKHFKPNFYVGQIIWKKSGKSMQFSSYICNH